MNRIGKGLLAGLAATVGLSALMVAKGMMGVMPELDIAKMIAGMMGFADQPIIGWVIHFMIGIVGYGVAIVLLDASLPGNSRTWHGVMIAVAGWLVMMVILMPMAGAGMFGMEMGLMAPMMTLVLHIIFGATLGWVYGRQLDPVSDGPPAMRKPDRAA